MLWKLSLIVGYAVNCAGYYLIGSSQGILMVFLVIQAITFSALIVCFFLFGFKMYRHTSSQVILITTLNMLCAVTIGNLFDTFLSLTHNYFMPNRNIILSSCFFIFLSFLSYSLWTYLKKTSTSIDNKNSAKRIHFLFNKLENSS
jgi:cation transport ATPase